MSHWIQVWTAVCAWEGFFRQIYYQNFRWQWNDNTISAAAAAVLVILEPQKRYISLFAHKGDAHAQWAKSWKKVQMFGHSLLDNASKC